MRHDAGRFIRNLLYWLASNFASRAVAAVLFIILARTSTVEQTGAYSLATTFQVLLIALTGWGFEHLLIRDIAKDRNSAPTHLSRYIVWRLALALMAYLLMVAIVFIIGYNADTRLVILVTCLALLTEGVNELLQAYLVAEQKTIYMFSASLPVNIIRLVTGVLLVPYGGPLALASLLVMTSAMKTGLLARVVMGRMVQFDPHSAFHLDDVRQRIAATAPFFAIDVAWIIEYQSGIIVLSIFADEESVGLYGVAFALVSLLLILSQAFMMAIFPIMSKLDSVSQSELAFIYQKSVELMLIVSLPIAISVTMMSDQVIFLIFPEAYAPSSQVLSILVWTIVFAYMHAPISRLMILRNTQNNMARYISIGALANVILNVALIPLTGIAGVAVARVVSYLLFFGLNFHYVNSKLQHIDVLRMALKPLVAGLAMTAVLLFVGDRPLLIGVLVGFSTYVLALAAMRVYSRQDVRSIFRALEEARI